MNKLARIFSLSTHAQERLAERSNLSAEEFLSLLNAGAYRRAFKKFSHSLSEEDQKKLINSYGLTKKDLFKFKIITVEIQFEHLVVWSTVDAAPLTAVVANDRDLVVTVLNADKYETEVWNERVTEEKIQQAKSRAEQFSASKHPNNAYQIFIRWLDSKTLSLISTIGTQDLESSRKTIEDAVRKFCAGGYAIHVSIRDKKDSSVLILDFEVDPIAG